MKFTLQIRLFLMVVLIFAAAVVATAQTRRASQPRRRQRPPIVSPAPRPVAPAGDFEVVGTAENLYGEGNNAESSGASNNSENNAPNGGTVRRRQPRTPATAPATAAGNNAAELARQVKALNTKIGQLESQQRNLVDLERLTRAEARAEALRGQLTAAIEKESALTAKIEELNFESRPEVIERSAALAGSLRPEEIRDARRRSVESALARSREQLVLAQESIARLRTAVANADSLADKLRLRVEAEDATPPDESEPTTSTEEPETEPAETTPDEQTPPPSLH